MLFFHVPRRPTSVSVPRAAARIEPPHAIASNRADSSSLAARLAMVESLCAEQRSQLTDATAAAARLESFVESKGFDAVTLTDFAAARDEEDRLRAEFQAKLAALRERLASKREEISAKLDRLLKEDSELVFAIPEPTA